MSWRWLLAANGVIIPAAGARGRLIDEAIDEKLSSIPTGLRTVWMMAEPQPRCLSDGSCRSSSCSGAITGRVDWGRRRGLGSLGRASTFRHVHLPARAPGPGVAAEAVLVFNHSRSATSSRDAAFGRAAQHWLDATMIIPGRRPSPDWPLARGGWLSNPDGRTPFRADRYRRCVRLQIARSGLADRVMAFR